MHRNVTLIAVFFLAFFVISASQPGTNQNNSLTILPEDCWVMAGEELLLELGGSVPSGSVVTWNVDDGGLASVLPGTNAVLMAPDSPKVVTVFATISPAGQDWEAIVTRQCLVVTQNDISY
jgi:hypothetical protein